MIVQWTVSADCEGVRLDVYLSENTGLTRSRMLNLIKAGACMVDGQAAGKAGFVLKAGMEVTLEIPEVKPTYIEAQEIPLTVIYQDSDLAVILKPAGMVVHPGAGNPDGTLVNALLHHIDDLSGIGGVFRPGIVHRLDKDTSGLLLIAKNDRSHVFLSEQIKQRRVTRAYKAIIIGNMGKESGQIDAPIGRHVSDRKKMAIVASGRNALTNWTVLERLRGACLIEARLGTGRTHQIRVHMASVGHPVLGDPVYGPKKSPYPVSGGQLLHAYKLGFTHPTTGDEMEFIAEPDERFIMWLNKLR